MKRIIILIFTLVLAIVLVRTNSKGKQITNHLKGIVQNTISKTDHINISRDSICTRVRVPKGFKRVNYKKGSFQEYLRNYKLKKHGSPIINYDGSEYFAQHWHDAILEVPVPKNGLQQCADALMRIRAEYLWENKQKDKIGFNFTSGHYCSWKEYAAGYRPKINGNKVTFHKTANPNNSKSNFYKYLNLIYTYAGTASLYNELPKIKAANLQIGDMLVQPGFPGHIEIIVDEVINEKNEKMFLLAQGNTPAQNVCLLKNFEDTNNSPWYQFSENRAIYTPSYYFDEPIFIRFK
ncbi:hypothetical protein BTO06_12670 [Tenacibaculum sp. SZ-18]|uniref:DUF4846 domain-containing protein n=1 Tax=Tenacibaculum sp. SZ-18 TaxID=754423 RepID=UPI000C2CF28B|nr:DUF4846 domain-containing protein [Tenacibaculum sp. SZ-18]AUC15952.1 hypothetical protein BTO06_12670 [Tenacibaculum sp. SZ-18]